ncbi:hypothetical protein BX616_009101, partial [Lobosporangium transversale]
MDAAEIFAQRQQQLQQASSEELARRVEELTRQLEFANNQLASAPAPPAVSRWLDPHRPAPQFAAQTSTFSGHEVAFDLDAWLKFIELQFRSQTWPDNKKVPSFVTILKGGALSWALQYIDDKGEDIGWDAFKEDFVKRWTQTHLSQNLRAQLDGLKMEKDEALISFMSRYVALANKIHDKSTMDKKLELARKLPQYIRNKLVDIMRPEDSLETFT